jgi:DNA-nicking Smr family endonuclease
MARKKKPIDNGAMSRLDDIIRQAGLQLHGGKSDASRKSEKPPSPAPAAKAVPSPSPTTPSSDADLFAGAMSDVRRVSWRRDPHPSPRPEPRPEPDPRAENLRLMREAMDENAPLSIPDHPEYIEGWVGVAGKRLLPNLRNGLYSIQGQIDLHGMSRPEAEVAVEDYIIGMSRFRSCCVKIIHGRGINSPADRATLKESLQRLLSTRKISRYVVAYASAAYRDGGVGAVYVLLCRQ